MEASLRDRVKRSQYRSSAMLPVIDLFAGAGGFGVAAAMAGASPLLSVELDPVACVTLKQNAAPGHTVREVDVSTCSGEQLLSWAGLSRSDALIVVGGAPCQPFSKASYWRDSGVDAKWRRDRARGVVRPRPPVPVEARPDDRRTLVAHFSRLVIETGADGFVFENVPAIQHPRNRPMLDALLTETGSAGYHTVVVKALASDYGVAQHRERIFVLGSRRREPFLPAPTHDGRMNGRELLPAVTSSFVCTPFSGLEYFEAEEVVTGTWAEHLHEVPPGSNYKFHTAWAGHPCPSFIAERRFWNFLLVLDPGLPSWTVPANPGPWAGPFHWDHRRLRTPELGAIQGFPKEHVFVGTRRERVRQIGNAVPPPMAAAMVRSVAASLA